MSGENLNIPGGPSTCNLTLGPRRAQGPLSWKVSLPRRGLLAACFYGCSARENGAPLGCQVWYFSRCGPSRRPAPRSMFSGKRVARPSLGSEQVGFPKAGSRNSRTLAPLGFQLRVSSRRPVKGSGDGCLSRVAEPARLPWVSPLCPVVYGAPDLLVLFA